MNATATTNSKPKHNPISATLASPVPSGKPATSVTILGDRIARPLVLRDHALYDGETKIGDVAPDDEVDLKLAEYAGRIVRMGAVEDVHAGGTEASFHFAPQEGAADVAAPVVLTRHSSGSWFGQVVGDATLTVLPGGYGGAVPSEISPNMRSASFASVDRALACFVSAEIGSNADFDVLAVATARLIEAFQLEREIRIASMLRNSTNWASGNVVTVAAGAKWNGGASKAPLANIFTVLGASALPASTLIMSEQTTPYFFGSADVRDFVQGGGKLPKVVVSRIRSKVGGALTSPFGGDVVLVREPASREDLGTARSFRWLGDEGTTDGRRVSGYLLRRFVVADRGARGGMLLVCAAAEAESMPATCEIGGLIVGATQ